MANGMEQRMAMKNGEWRMANGMEHRMANGEWESCASRAMKVRAKPSAPAYRSRASVRAFPFAIRHSPFAARHRQSPFADPVVLRTS